MAEFKIDAPLGYQPPNPVAMPADGEPSPSQNSAESRAARATVGLGTIANVDQPTLSRDFQNGKENQFRETAAMSVDGYNEQLRRQAVIGFVDRKEIVPPELLNAPPKSDPSTVIERSFANSFTAFPHNDLPPLWFFAKQENPYALKASEYLTKESVAKDQYIRTKLEEATDQYNSQSWIGWGFDQAKDLFQPWEEIKMRGSGEDVSRFSSALLGNELVDRAKDILSHGDLEHMKPALDAALAPLTPTEKLHFLQYIMQLEDPAMDNLMTFGMAASGAASTAKGVKMFLKVSHAAKDIREAARVVGHGLPDMTSEEIQWGTDGGRNIDREVSPPVAKATAQGDVKEAAVQTVVQQRMQDATQRANPTERAVKAISPAFRRLKASANSMGTKSQELVNRINEDIQSKYARFVGLLHSQRAIDVMPDISRNPEAVRAITEQTVREHPELSGHVVETRGFSKDPTTRNWFAQIVLGQADAQGFSTYTEAKSFARDVVKQPLQTNSWGSVAKGIWKNKNIELPVDILDEKPTKGSDGVMYQKVRHEGTDSHVPVSELKKTGEGEPQFSPGVYIEQSGARSFYVVKDVPVDHTKGIIKQFYGSTGNSQAPWGPIKAWAAWLRSPEDTWSFDQRAAAQIATEGPSAFYRMAKDSTKNMEKLTRTEANDLDRLLTLGQDLRDPNTGEPGYYFNSIQEIEDHYQLLFNDGKTHIPSDNFVRAYYEFKANMEMAHWLKEIGTVRHFERLGGQQHKVLIRGADGKPAYSPWFIGRRVQFVPRGLGDSVAVIPDNIGAGKKFVWSGNQLARTRVYKQLLDDVAAGKARVLEIIDPDSHPLENFIGIKREYRVQYVISYNPEERPIALGSVTKRMHPLDNEFNHYVSQARIVHNPITNQDIYLGDANLFGTHHAADARAAAKVIDGMSSWVGLNNKDGARAYWESVGGTHGLTFDKVWDAFFPTRDQNGNIRPALLDAGERIQHRPKQTLLYDTGKSALEDRHPGLINGTREGSAFRASSQEYTGERDPYDFWGIRDVGTKYNPIFQAYKDEFIDAVPSMNRGLGKMINSLFMDDFKTTSVNHWMFGAQVPSAADPTKLVGAREYLTATAQQIEHAPFHYFHHGVWKPDTPENIKNFLEANRVKIKSFIGLPSKYDSFLHSLEQKMTDTIYSTFGPKSMKLIPLWQVPMATARDAPRILRSIIYNTKMGFFSPRQFLIHFFTFINAALIAPRFAGHGAMGAMFHGWTKLSSHPEVLSLLDEKASKMGWKPGMWREAHDTLLSTGFNHVDINQMSIADNPMANRLIQNKWNTFLHAGMSPFRGGVGSLKAASWYTAFKEFRDTIKPVGKLTDEDVEKILVRANDLSHNMSRASSSMVQKGMMTFGAQFSSYNLRLMELLVGKRLTRMERARLFGGYMTIFGVPTAGGIIGLNTWMRNQVDKGNVPGLTEYTPGHDFLSTAIMEGLVPSITNELTGHVPNLGESYGAKDLEMVERALDSDTTVWEFFGGAAYSTLTNTWANTSPFRHAMWSILTGSGPYTITAQDWAHLVSEVSSANYAYRTYLGLELGKYMSRNGQYLEPTSPEWAIVSGLSGLADQQVADIYRTGQSIRDRRAGESQAMREYAKVMSQWFIAKADNNEGQADALGKNAAILLQAIPVQDRARVWAIAARDGQPLVDRINFQRWQDRAVPDADKGRQRDIEMKRQEVQRTNQ